MSNYPVWWDTTLTIYNQYEDPQTQIVRWYRHTVTDCFWKYSGDKVTIQEVVIDTNSIICRIPQSSQFKERYEWIALPNDEMEHYFTLGINDIIVRGNVTDEIDEYTSGRRSGDLISKYKNLQGCMEIQGISINTGRGRNNPHYYVRGI